MACYAKDVIDIALAEVGYLEKENNKNLDNKTANAGDENYTKYSRDFDTKYPDFYNTKKQGAEWCDIFVDWCLVKAFGVDAALKLLGQPKKSCGAGCYWSANYYKQIKCFYTTPKVGDQIFYKDSKGEPCHTGLVYKVDSTYVYTIEGNTSSTSGVVANGGAVAKKKYRIDYSRIYGYGRPKYDVEKETQTTTTVKKEGTCTVKLKVLQKGSKGSDVKSLQLLLIGYGYSCGKAGADGDFGTGTASAVKKYQKAKGLTADGIVGEKTWKKLLGV